MSGFSERYKDYRVTELLVILQNKEDYTSEAITAAKRELDKRQISENERHLAQEKIRNFKHNEDLDYYNKIDAFLDNFKPIKFKENRSTIYLNRICFLIISLLLYYIISGQEYFRLIFLGFQKVDVFTLIYFAELITLPFVLYILFKKKTYAWTFSSLFCVIKLLHLLIFSFSWFFHVIIYDFENFNIQYFYRDFIVLAFYIFILWLLYRPSIKELFDV